MEQYTQTGQRRQYIGILSASAVVAFYIFAFFPAWRGLITAWYHSDDYSHAFFILPLSMYLAWDKKEKLAQLPVTPSWAGFFVILCSILLYLFSFSAGIMTLSSFALVLSIIGIVLALFGGKITKELAFPLFFLFFMIPIPSQLYFAATNPLQLIVSQISVFFAALMDVPIYREGNVLHLPDRTLQVVAACSGMRSMIALTTLSMVFGYISLKNNFSRGFLVLTAFPIAVFINIIRVLAMVLGFHYFNYDLTGGSPHTYLGLSVFVLAMLIIVLIQNILSRLER